MEMRLRVHATQSTHKTLTALRQGSMIRVFDGQFGSRNEESFREAYMTHSSTSPNHQILASLDVGRRQVQLEGFKLVQQQVEYAKNLRRVITSHPLLRRWFRVLIGADLIPEQYRRSGEDDPDLEDSTMLTRERWSHDEFVLDPSRATYVRPSSWPTTNAHVSTSVGKRRWHGSRWAETWSRRPS